MHSKKFVRVILFILSLAGWQIPTTAYALQQEAGGEAKVYFEKDCLALFSSHGSSQLGDNETKVEESRSNISFEKLTVTESRDGVVVDTYIQVRNCRPADNGDHF
jgi:hypothetical protein